MMHGSRSDAPRCANCGKEAENGAEDLVNSVGQPFRDLDVKASVPTGLNDVGMVFCDGDCLWTYNLLGKGKVQGKRACDPSHPSG